MINYTIDELMSRLGCEKFPERWREIYGEALSIYNNDENPLLHPRHYDHLHEAYKVFDGELLEIYKRAVSLLAENAELSLFFCILCRALRDRATIQRDIAQMAVPTAPEGSDPLPYDMLTALSLCQSYPAFYQQMRAHNVPEDILFESLKIPEKCVALHLRRSGKPRLTSFDWYQHAYDGRLYRVGRLQLEFPQGTPGIYRVFENKDGKIVAFANLPVHRDGFPLGSKNYEDEEGSFTATLEETDDAYIGYPYLPNGHISTEKMSLSKSEWSIKLKGGDPIVGLHIPPDEPFGNDIVEDAISGAKKLLATCYPEYKYKAFFCASWLCDPELINILGENANISKFCGRFIPLSAKSNAKDVFGYVYRAYGDDIDVASLPENTSLQKALKKHYLSGNAIYVMHGVFF